MVKQQAKSASRVVDGLRMPCRICIWGRKTPKASPNTYLSEQNTRSVGMPSPEADDRRPDWSLTREPLPVYHNLMLVAQQFESVTPTPSHAVETCGNTGTIIPLTYPIFMASSGSGKLAINARDGRWPLLKQFCVLLFHVCPFGEDSNQSTPN